MFKSLEEFLAWEQTTNDTIDFKRCYVDLAGDVKAGLLLSMIIYWHLPNEKGISKLRVQKKNQLWIAKARKDWWKDCRLTPRQSDIAIGKLKNKKIIETKRFRFNGIPTVHIRLLWENFIPQLSELLTRQGENSFNSFGKMDFTDSGKSLTKNTTENTTKNTKEIIFNTEKNCIKYNDSDESLNLSSNENVKREPEMEAIVSNEPEDSSWLKAMLKELHGVIDGATMAKQVPESKVRKLPGGGEPKDEARREIE